MRSLKWYAKRLSVMKPREIAFRVGEQLTLGRMRLGQWRGTGRLPGRAQVESLRFCTAAHPNLPELRFEFNPSPPEIEALLAGEYPALGVAWRWSPDDDAWRRAPETGRLWPNTFFHGIHYREGNRTGDVRIAWEPGRLQQLVALSLLGDSPDAIVRRKAVVLIESQLESWVRLNPPLSGIHYISAMECALRMVAVCHALDKVRGRLLNATDTWSALADLVESHARFIDRRLSLHSSTGNHTIAECAGLVYAGVLFPELRGAQHWKQRGLKILEQEADRQILPDGGGVEQAFWYLLFITDLFGLVAELLRHHNEPVPAAIDAAVRRARVFLSALADRPVSLPRIGDADDGYALSPALRISWEPRTTGAGLRTFPDAGYTVLSPLEPRVNTAIFDRAPLLERGACVAIFDHGSLGMPPSYGHGHADALAVHITINGLPLFTDSGTYLYTGAPAWRRYFRGTRAHNTIMVDGTDQAQQETAFLWSKIFHNRLIRSETSAAGTARVLATHDGYRAQGVTHWRAVVRWANGVLLVWDWLEGEGAHALELNWHVAHAPENVDADGLEFAGYPQAVRLSVTGGAMTSTSGRDNPPHGWRSEQYGCKTASTVLSFAYRGPLPHAFVTVLLIGGTVLEPDQLQHELTLLRGWIDEAKAN